MSDSARLPSDSFLDQVLLPNGDPELSTDNDDKLGRLGNGLTQWNIIPEKGSKVTRPAAAENEEVTVASNERIDAPVLCEWEGCSVTFTRSRDRKRHVKTIHENPGSYICEVDGCDKVFNRNDNLKGHMRNIHGRRK